MKNREINKKIHLAFSPHNAAGCPGFRSLRLPGAE